MKRDSFLYSNYVFLGTIITLIGLGIIVLAGISAPISQEKFGYSSYYLIHQIKYGLIPGIILGFLAYKVPLSLIRKWSLALLLGNLVLLGLVFIPQISFHVYGASRWINLGFVSFQPSEFLKISFIVYLAAWLSNFSHGIKNSKEKIKWIKKWNKEQITETIYKTLAPFLIIISLISLFLIKQPDISTLGIILITALLMYFSAGTPFWHSIFMILLGVSALIILIKTAPYRLNRILTLFDPRIEPMGISYQIKQSLIAIGSGGIFGVGLGMSYQKFGFLPQSMSDSIFSIYAEETGFIGAMFLILLFLFFFWQGYKIYKKTVDEFARLLVLGICSWISIQALIHISSMIGIFPLTGIPLPFISYGGSHLLAEMIGIGLLFNISKNI
ncbi:cell division protein FtsW [Candidatus Parcubacteria bacterium]|nr:cell division protein FtsW [Candidatus Parcubacteria bacterium]